MEQNQEIKLGDGTIFEGVAKKRDEQQIGLLLNACDRGYAIFILDDQTVNFLERYLSDIHNYFNALQVSPATDQVFTRTHLLVTIDNLFKMMENGLYPLTKLQVILLHLL